MPNPLNPDEVVTEVGSGDQSTDWIRTGMALDRVRELEGLCRANNDLARMNGKHRDEWREKAVICMDALEIVANGDVDVSDTAIIVGSGASTVIRQLRDALSQAQSVLSTKGDRV